MSLIFDATIVKGAGVATKNIKFQMPHLVWQFPDIRNVHTASINVKFDEPPPTLIYDIITLPVPWWDVDERQGHWAYERFGFLEINLEHPTGGNLRRAWLFDCHNSASHKSPVHFEIISEKIDGLSYDQRCRVHISKSKLRT